MSKFNHEGYYVCECGREFTNSQAFNGHKGRCKVFQIKKYGNLDKYEESKKITNDKRIETLKEKTNLEKLESLTKWVTEQHTCEKCGKVMIEKFGSGRFCCRSCANKHSGMLEETKRKIAQGVLEAQRKYCSITHVCIKCGNQFIPDSCSRKKCYDCQPKKEKEISVKKTILDFSKRTISKIMSRLNIPCSNCGFHLDGVVLDIHHIIPKSQGGSNDMSNLAYICPNCHRIIHSNIKSNLNLIPLDKYLENLNLNWEDYYYYDDE